MYDLKQVFSTAIELEESGYKFYIDAANKSSDSVEYTILQALADDEQEHQRLLNEFYNAMIESKGWPVLDNTSNTPDEARRMIMAILNDTSKAIKHDGSFIGIYEAAESMEKESRDFYSDEYEKALDIDVKRFFQYLSQIEDIHAKALGQLIEFARSAEDAVNGNKQP